ncbi:MAG: CAP domain-containing protein [Verrucomicrobiales bacterium]
MMKLLCFLSSLCALVLLNSCGGNGAEKEARALASRMSPREAQLAVGVWQAANGYRESIGKGEMEAHRGLTALAQKHAERLRNLQGAPVPEEHQFASRAVRVYRDYKMAFVQEFVYTGEVSDGREAVWYWQSQELLRRQLGTNWNRCGVGVAVTEDGQAHVVMLTGLRSAHNRLNGPPGGM